MRALEPSPYEIDTKCALLSLHVRVRVLYLAEFAVLGDLYAILQDGDKPLQIKAAASSSANALLVLLLRHFVH